MPHDDNDVKIFSHDDDSDRPDPDAVARQYSELRESGAIDTARRVGDALADKVLAPVEYGCSEQLSPEVFERQTRILKVFVARESLKQCMPHVLLADTASRVMYDRLERDDPDLYADIIGAQEMTLYLLAYRTDRSDPYFIGHVFAQLCGCERSESVIKLGQTIYNDDNQAVCDLIDTFDLT